MYPFISVCVAIGAINIFYNSNLFLFLSGKSAHIYVANTVSGKHLYIECVQLDEVAVLTDKQ